MIEFVTGLVELLDKHNVAIGYNEESKRIEVFSPGQNTLSLPPVIDRFLRVNDVVEKKE